MILVSLAGPAAGAGVYRWVDDQGRVHFGDRPQSEAASEVKIRVEPQSSPPTTSEAERARHRRRLLEVYQEDREAKKEAARKQKEERAKRAAECDTARNRLAKFDRAGSLYHTGPDGERQYLSFEERDRYIAGLRQQVNSLCR